MSFDSSNIYGNLDTKLKIGGLEALDLILVLGVVAVINFLFGSTPLFLPMVVILPALILLVLLIGKRNKPDGFLAHLIKFYLTPGFYSAGEDSPTEQRMKERIYE